MTTIRIKEVELPSVLPVGWKSEVAKAAGVGEKTVYNAIRKGMRGPQCDRAREVYKSLYGKPTVVEIDK
jgi:hypothetical protein